MSQARMPSRSAAVRFLFVAGALVALYFWGTTSAVFENRVLPDHLEANARAAAAVLRLADVDAATSGTLIGLTGFRLNVVRGCDALDPAAFLAAAILAFPAPLRRKLAGLAAGTVALLALNVVRIVVLCLVGARWPEAYETFHVEVCQVSFILVVFFLWIAWARWVSPPAATTRTA